MLQEKVVAMGYKTTTDEQERANARALAGGSGPAVVPDGGES
ncbi:MAG: hypothetical protein AAF533_21510 [Acidobacteriota bacterium]